MIVKQLAFVLSQLEQGATVWVSGQSPSKREAPNAEEVLRGGDEKAGTAFYVLRHRGVYYVVPQ